MNILIGADLVPTKSNQYMFSQKEMLSLVGEELFSLLNSADYRIFNLELPLTDEDTPISKCGPSLRAATDTVEGYQAIHADLLTLANNHILDHGEQGLKRTIEVLEESCIPWVGVGDTLETASKPHLFTCEGKQIGVYACVEHEFSVATDKTPGANPFDPLESPDHVAMLREKCDYVIVLYHGGKEHYRYPSPNLQKNCRKLVEKGADLVICQHSHCIGCEEKYMHGTIVYGQGNFIFDLSDDPCWQTGILVQLTDHFSVSYIPVEKTGNKVRMAQGDAAEKILEAFYKRSQEIREPDRVAQLYSDYAQTMVTDYLLKLSGLQKNLLIRIVNKLSGRRFALWLVKKRFDRNTLLMIRNYIECEAHQELLLRGIGGRIQ